MLDSLFIGTSGLQTFSAGLKVISNNVANLNTPGFKSADAQFAGLYNSTGDGSAVPTQGNQNRGSGVALGETFLNFQAGDTRQTGNPLDLSVNGAGFFVTKSSDGARNFYTRAGQFEFDKNGKLVLRGTDRQIMGMQAGGTQSPISLDGLRINPPKASATIALTGNISSSATEVSVASIKAIDSIGGEHILKVVFKPKAGSPGTWSAEVFEGTTSLGTGEVKFVAGVPVVGSSTFTFNLTPATGPASTLTVDLSKGVTSFDSGTSSSLALGSVDGYAVGALTKVSFDADGTMVLTYSNGQTAKNGQLLLAQFDNLQALTPEGNNEFSLDGREGLRLGVANQSGLGSISSNQIEGSNVDLASEFSDLIVMQRGYQASSRIVSTANELLQDLFDMKGHR